MSAAPDAAALPRAVPIPGGSVLCGHQDPGPGGPSESHRAGADTGMLRPHLGTAIRAEFSWGKAAGRACNSKQRPRALPETTTVVPPATHRALAQLGACAGRRAPSLREAGSSCPRRGGAQLCGPGDARHGSRTRRCRSDPCPSISHFACHCFCTIRANTNTGEANSSI